MYKKGFTLIELLAVIIILAVIALIATPITVNIIQKSKKEANKDSVYGLIEASKLYYSESMLDNSKTEKLDGSTNLIDYLSISGEKPDSGYIYVNQDGLVALSVVYDNVCYKKNFTDKDITESNDNENCKIDVACKDSSTQAYNNGYANGVSDTKQGTAVASQVLEGYTFTNSSNVNISGTMKNNGELNWKPNTLEKYTLKEGYYSGGTLDTSLVFNTGYNDGIKVTKQGTAVASQVLEGYTFTNSSNVNISGTMKNNGALNWKPSTSTTYTVPAGYYSGGTLDTSLVFNTGYNDGIKVTKQGTAVASQVLEGYTFTNSSNINISGTMKNNGALNWKPSTSTKYTVPAGYYSGGTLDSSGAYNAGVTAADSRTNTNSKSYKSGYNAGYNAGYNGAIPSTLTWTSSYTSHDNNGVAVSESIPCYGYSKIQVTYYTDCHMYYGVNLNGTSYSNSVGCPGETKTLTANVSGNTFYHYIEFNQMDRTIKVEFKLIK